MAAAPILQPAIILETGPRMSIEVEALFRYRDELGESPHWDGATETLLRVDNPRGLVHRLDPQTGEQATIALDAPIGFVIPSGSGSLVVGIGHTVQRVDPDGSRSELATVEADQPQLRLNDAKCDRQGQLWFGSLSAAKQPAGGLYRLASDGQLDQVLSEITISNGLGWDYQRSRFYYVDSWQQRVDVFDCDPATGEVSDRRPFAHIAAETGLPDGLAVDAEGGVWLALFYGGAVHRYDADGRLSEVVRLPVSCPTSVAFGGAGLSTLYITSARDHLDADQYRDQPLAGAVLECAPGVTGAAVPGFSAEPA